MTTSPPVARPSRWTWLDDARRDIPYALRALRRSPGFTSLAVVTIALGIGANAAVFSVVNTVLLRPLPYAQPERLVRVWESMRGQPDWLGSVSYPNLKDWREQTRSFAHLVGYTTSGMNFEGGTEPELVAVVAAEAPLFDMLRVRPLLGRPFAPDEDREGRNHVVVLSEGFWRQALGGEPGAVGREIRLDGAPYTVIGVMPSTFRFPAGGSSVDAWRPYTPGPGELNSRGSHFLSVVGRLRDGVAPDAAFRDLAGVAERISTQFPDDQAERTVAVRGLHEAVTGRVRPALTALLAAVALVLLIACANVANLQLARAAVRRREIAVRLAIGAGRGQLVRQFLTESVCIAVAGCLLAVAVARWGIGALSSALSSTLPTTEAVALDARVFGVLMLVSVVCGVLFGLAPAAYASPQRLRGTLTGSGTKSTSTRGEQAFRHSLVVAQIAFSLLLLIGAGLLMRAFLSLRATSSGMVTEGVLTMRITSPLAQDSTAARTVTRLYRPVLERVRAIPGVTDAGMTSLLPIDNWGWNSEYHIDGQPVPAPGKARLVENRVVSPGYFRTMGIPVVQGRDVQERDAADGTQPVVVNEAFAKLNFPDGRALGERIRRGEGPGTLFTIVGVAGSVRQAGLDREPLPEMYIPYGSEQGGFPDLTLVVRGSLPPAQLLPTLRSVVRQVDPRVPTQRVRLMDQVVDDSLAGRRLSLFLVGSFAVLALLLAASGLYGVISFLVAQRTPEIGVRMALGADRGTILRLMLGRSALLAVTGIAIGLLGAFWLSRLLARMLYGIGVHDTVTFVGAPLLLAVTALVAALIPSLRAARTDPIVALRAE